MKILTQSSRPVQGDSVLSPTIFMIIVQGLILLGILFTYLLYPHFYIYLVTEDQVGEWLTFSSLGLASFILALIVFFSKEHSLAKIWYAILMIGLFLISMEEISWGQRIFWLDSPEFFKTYNFQNEIGFHNIRALSPDKLTYIIVGCSFILYACYPLFVKLVPKLGHLQEIIKLPTAPLFLAPIIAITGYMLAFNHTYKGSEIGELLIGLSMLFLSVHWLSASFHFKFVRSIHLIALGIALIVALICTFERGTEYSLSTRWHGIADSFVKRGMGDKAITVLDYVESRANAKRWNTNLIRAKAMKQLNELDNANTILIRLEGELKNNLTLENAHKIHSRLAVVYTELGDEKSAISARSIAIEKNLERIKRKNLVEDDLSTAMIDVALLQYANNLKEGAIHSLYKAGVNTKSALIKDDIENILENIVADCFGKPVVRVRINALISLPENVSYEEFCRAASS